MSKFFWNQKTIGKLSLDESASFDIFPISDGYTPSSHGENKDFVSRAINFKRISLFLFIVLFGIIGLVLRAWHLQVAMGSYYRGIAEGNRTRTEVIKAKRGIIYDSRMRQIAYNKPKFFLHLNPAQFFKQNTKEDLKNLIASGGLEINFDFSEKDVEDIVVSDNLTYEQALSLKPKIKNFTGVYLETANIREYNDLESLSHIIGYTGRINKEELEKNKSKYLPSDFIGKSGLELFYEEILRGIDAKKEIEVDAMGREKFVISSNIPKDGKNLVLTVNYDLQKKVEEILNEHLKKLKLKEAVVIAINPQNGAILASVSLPSFNASNFAYKIDEDKYFELLNDPYKPLFNRAVLGEYPSGSIIKPVLAAGALNDGSINERTTFISVGGIKIGSWFFPDWRAGGHGATDVKKAIADSVNTFFYILGGGYGGFSGVGPEKLAQYKKNFGLGSETGVDMPYEKKGFIPTPEWKEEVRGESWYIGDTYHIAIGQGDFLLTPMQAAVFNSIIAARGKHFAPRFVDKIIDLEENEEKVEPKILNEQVVDEHAIKIVAEGMRQAVTSGSARRLSLLSVTSAGKTGTAQHGTDKEPHGWFIGFAPYENPEISIVVLVPEGGGGSIAAAPIAYDILKWYFDKEN